jgi:hypothetical protein
LKLRNSQLLTLLFVLLAAVSLLNCLKPIVPPETGPYPLHPSITVTIFWIGEPDRDASGCTGNEQSAWDTKWQEHYGGLDDPTRRNGWWPAGFKPKENPFYCALPYNDFTTQGRRPSAYQMVYWAHEKTWSDTESMCKNQWVRIVDNQKTAYAQWEDVGPFLIADSNYVFGQSRPGNAQNDSVGLDVSPAVRDYLGLSGLDKVDWQFVSSDSVPDGPWKDIVTTRQVCWGRNRILEPRKEPLMHADKRGFISVHQRSSAVPEMRVRPPRPVIARSASDEAIC